MNRKGVCYDAGRVMMGESWRPKFDETLARRELGIIKEDLHCNSVRVCGLDDRPAGRREPGRAGSGSRGLVLPRDVGQEPG